VTGGAQTTEAVRSVGARRRRRTSHQRHPPGAHAGVRGRQRQSYERGPFAPSPALRRVQPASGTVARRRLPCRGGHPSQTSAWPDTARTSGGGWAAHHRRSRRSSPDTLSPVPHVAGPPAAKARAHSWRARCGVVAKGRSAGTPAGLPRGRSSVPSLGRDRARAHSAWPSGLA
jgi:hypothetical protein